MHTNLKIFLITKHLPQQLTYVEPFSKIRMLWISLGSQKNTSLGFPLSPMKKGQISTLDFNGIATKPKKTNPSSTITNIMTIPHLISSLPTTQKDTLKKRTTRAKHGMMVMILMLIPLDLF